MDKEKILFIVDDEPDVKLALKIALEENGFKVDAFDDPIMALDNFRKEVYDLLILILKCQRCMDLNYIEKLEG